MRNFTRYGLLFSIILCLCITIAKGQAGLCNYWPRFDQEVFTVVNKTIDVVYGANTDYQGVNTILKMDVYEPDGDTMSMRPLIIFAHGGSFVAGDKSNGDQADLCTSFAKRGYICATINYRLGIDFPIGAATATDAVYRSVQDMKAAVRFFRKDAATSNIYKINPSIIFIGGTSAGAFTALQYAYLNTYPELPATVDTLVLGNLEGNSGNPGYQTDINAVVNLCGAMGQANWLIPGDVPLVSMHGTTDATVPYGTAMLMLLNIFPIVVVDGSYSIHDHINTFNHPSEMYTWYGQGHVPFSGTSAVNIAYMDTAVRFVSNFLYKTLGCTPSNSDPVQNTFTTVGIGEIANQEIRLGNNPADEELILFLPGTERVNFTMSNSTGQIVLSSFSNSSDDKVKIRVKDLPDGIYLLHFKSVNKSGVFKVIVAHSRRP